MDVDVIKAVWKEEANRSIELGNFYHEERMCDFYSINSISLRGVELPVIKTKELEDWVQEVPEQRLVNGIYPEFFLYDDEYKVCGRADLIEKYDNRIYITDYKTYKKVVMPGDNKFAKNMLGMLSHLEDCNYNHTALQLSFYAYIICKHNPDIEQINLYMSHVKFKEVVENNNRILLRENGRYIVDSVEYIRLPYYKDDVTRIIKEL